MGNWVKTGRTLIAVALVSAFSLTLSCKRQETNAPPSPTPPPPAVKSAPALPPASLPLGLDADAALIPEGNPITAEKVALGRLLYFDGRLSRDGTVSCATCHHPGTGWTDKGPTSTGIGGQKGGRRAPTVLNRLFSDVQFWDGRAASLEEQAKGPIENPIEMGFTHKEVVARLSKIAEYGPYFEKAFGDKGVSIDRIARAIASFERTVVTGDSPFDKWQYGGDEAAVSEEVKAGFKVFRGKARCGLCHAGANFTDERYHNLGVGIDRKTPDLGRYEVTKRDEDRGAFKTPTLRDLEGRAPYLHDGSHRTLDEVIALYEKGGVANPHLSPLIQPFELADSERAALLAFLGSLNGQSTKVEIPTVFPGGWRPGMAVE